MIWLRKKFVHTYRHTEGLSYDPRPSSRGDMTDLRVFRYEFSSLRALLKPYRRSVTVPIVEFPVTPSSWMADPCLRNQINHGISASCNPNGLILVMVDGHDLMDWLARNVQGKCKVALVRDTSTRFGQLSDYKYADIMFTDERDEAAFRIVFDVTEKIF